MRPLHPTALVTGGNRGIGRAIAAGLNVAAFKLYYTGSGGSATAVSLAGAVISGSGSSYSIRLPATAATLRGSYQLDIGGPGTSVTVDGQPMPRVSSFFWRLP